MSHYELHLDEGTFARAKRLAEERNVSLEDLVSEALEWFTVGNPELHAAGAPLEQILSPVLSAADKLVAESTNSLEHSNHATLGNVLVEKYRAQGFRL